nr:ubiquitin carboxyl-terminal hydrolase 8-like isoform X3 [Cherax quadricarinatus]
MCMFLLRRGSNPDPPCVKRELRQPGHGVTKVWVVRTIGVSLVNWTRRRVDSMKHLKLKTQEERELRRLQQLTGSTLPQQLQTETEQSPLIPKQQDLELGQVGQQKEGELQKKQREELKRQNEQGKQNKKKIRLPSPHRTTVGSLDDLFQDYEQKEAHDFMSMMIQWLHDDMVQIQGAGGEGETGVSLVSKLFHGTHTSTITCPKKEEIICQVSEPFSNLTLAVNKSGCCDLQDLLQKYYREQQIDWECNQCLKEHKCHHSTSLQHLPSILVIHLSRFNKDKPYGKKTEVTFPANRLSLSQFTHSAEDKQYELYGVCTHAGSMTGGHYTAYCKNWDFFRWYRFNDSEVQEVEEKQVMSQHYAHILFYRTPSHSILTRQSPIVS